MSRPLAGLKVCPIEVISPDEDLLSLTTVLPIYLTPAPSRPNWNAGFSRYPDRLKAAFRGFRDKL